MLKVFVMHNNTLIYLYLYLEANFYHKLCDFGLFVDLQLKL